VRSSRSSTPRLKIQAIFPTAFGSLCAQGLVACDFYDGSLIYDFARHVIHLVDLDHYRAPFINEAGRLPGSTRFMAPEEFTLGGRIDERPTVFTLGRVIERFLSDVDAVRELALHACHPDPEGRFRAVADFEAEWARVTKGWVSG
jgi:serine/threonine-protein kinase